MAKHTLSVLVENHAGVLSRIAGLFSRRDLTLTALQWVLLKILRFQE